MILSIIILPPPTVQGSNVFNRLYITYHVELSVRNNHFELSVRNNHVELSVRNDHVELSVRNNHVELSVRNNVTLSI